jgi:hypothetical protein
MARNGKDSLTNFVRTFLRASFELTSQ